MSLFRIDTNNKTSGYVQSAPYSPEYLQLLNRLPKELQDELYSFIRTSLQQEREFNVASIFGRNSLAWDEVPLIYLYQLVNEDEETAGKLLGLMVMDVLIEDARAWLCFKSPMRGRRFPTNYYWLKAG